MRDGIHKGASVSRPWKTFIKHSARAFDRGTKALQSAERAVANLAKQISPSFLNSIRKILSEPQLNLLGLRPDLEGLKSSVPLHPVEARVLEHLINQNPGKTVSDEDFKHAVHFALVEKSDDQLRAIEIDLQAESPRDRQELMKSMREILHRVDYAQTANDIVAGSVQQAPEHEQFDWEQDLGLPL